jgi:Ca-activated chloride channel homolog
VLVRTRARLCFPFQCPDISSLAWTSLISLCLLGMGALAQTRAPSIKSPSLQSGTNLEFAQVDFGQMYRNEEVWEFASKDQISNLADSGVVSVLDLQASKKAVQQFQQGTSLLRAQKSKQAIKYLQKAIEIYPAFVSAHNALGFAYLDQQDARAKDEFETAANLDDQFAGPLLNLGALALRENDFAKAELYLQKAANLVPGDPRTLAALAYAQEAGRKFAECLQTVQRVHAMDHHGLASVHYLAAAAAMSMNDLEAGRRELTEFLGEDPVNPLSPAARKSLGELAIQESHEVPRPTVHVVTPDVRLQGFPNSERLRAQLSEVEDESAVDCQSCEAVPEPSAAFEPAAPASAKAVPTGALGANLFTIRRAVDETALFFAVSNHGHLVNDLTSSDIQIRDDNKPPDKILEFVPQSQVPIRLGLLIDASNSVERRFAFEKRAAEKFVETMVNGQADLAFVAGFTSDFSVTQDFTSDVAELREGVEKLAIGGETALFDAIYRACWKLAAFPDEDRVARVLVVLTDGEDNSSHRSLRQALEEAEAGGVTVYTVSTSENTDTHTDANRILQVLSERSGGESILPGNLHALDRYLVDLTQVIRSRYLIAYKAADFTPDGKYRTVQVSAAKEGKRLQVHVRKGYYARLAASEN